VFEMGRHSSAMISIISFLFRNWQTKVHERARAPENVCPLKSPNLTVYVSVILSEYFPYMINEDNI
jgi:hypothetical protein